MNVFKNDWLVLPTNNANYKHSSSWKDSIYGWNRFTLYTFTFYTVSSVIVLSRKRRRFDLTELSCYKSLETQFRVFMSYLINKQQTFYFLITFTWTLRLRTFNASALNTNRQVHAIGKFLFVVFLHFATSAREKGACTGRSSLSRNFWQHENLSGLSIIQLIHLLLLKPYLVNLLNLFWQKIRAKWEYGLTAVQLKRDPPVLHYCRCYYYRAGWWLLVQSLPQINYFVNVYRKIVALYRWVPLKPYSG